jgi:two-component system KDP operon response regulator KdpE
MNKVLIVDDEPQIRRALSLNSLNLGVRKYDVLEAATGTDALAIAAAEHPDVVLLDLGLPDMDGRMVLEVLRRRSSVAVIVLTVRDDERSRIDALEAGADDYVTKPFDMAELVERIRVILIRNHQQVSPGQQPC